MAFCKNANHRMCVHTHVVYSNDNISEVHKQNLPLHTRNSSIQTDDEFESFVDFVCRLIG